MVEDIEKRIERTGLSHPLLDVVNDNHVNGLVEADKVVDGILKHRIGILHLEKTRRHIQHALLRIELLSAHANGIDEVGLATA